MRFAAKRAGMFARNKGQRIVLSGLAVLSLATSLFGCGGSKNSTSAADSKLLYTESNDPTRNVILAFRRAADGSLTPLASSPIDLRGQGFPNPQEQPGPPDADQQIITNANRTLMFAVNSGSSTIAVLKINTDGSLAHISGSPFASGGINPYTLYLLGNKLYCGNKNVGSGASGGSGTPNYTVFNVGADGTLTQITGATVSANAGSSPSQVLASPDGKTMFTNDFFGALASPATGSLRSYKINADGSLTQNGSALTPPTTVPANTAPPFVPFYSLVQGVQVHPTQRIVYATVPITNQLAVYTYDASGVLSFNSFAPVSGVIPCWLVINKAQTRMYIVETGSNSVSTIDITTPLAPKEVQYLPLGNAGPTFPLLPILPPLTSSAAAEEALDPNGNFLYVVSHHANPAPSFNGGGVLHTLKVNSDGTLTEQGVGLDLQLSNAAHPQGVVAF